MGHEPSAAADERVPFSELLALWGKVGLIGFGGPAGQIALMHRLVVEQKRWLGEARFLSALNYCMLLPGPEAQQLATYIGWLMHGVRGGIAAGLLFILPGSLVMLGLSVLYVAFGELPVIQAVFFGIKAAVLAIVLEAVERIARRALKSSLLIALAAAAFVAIFFFAVPFPLVVLSAGLIGFFSVRNGAANGNQTAAGDHDGLIDRLLDRGELSHTRPNPARSLLAIGFWSALWLAPVGILSIWLGPEATFTKIATFFATMAIVTFGGAYAVLAYVAQEAVATYGWLSADEMLKGLALAETTPGPLILVLEFVGFLAAYRDPGILNPYVAGVLGAALTLWVTFAPSFIWILAGAPYAEALRRNPKLAGALSAITAAVVGVILNLAIWFALNVVFARVGETTFGPLRLYQPEWMTFDPLAAALAALALLLLLRARLGMLTVLALMAAAGVGVWQAGL
ncbi:MAG: chromate efflux transporter [Alphaproteobacteria bacterium]|nr:chromate efflux transporter [Alphaproteobacteria bacterium]